MNKLLLMGCAIKLAISLTMPIPASAQSEPGGSDFQQGLMARTAWENWLNALPPARPDLRVGALAWATNRSLPNPTNCYALNEDQQKGCILAKELLDPTDVRRKSNPAYRAGWNSYSAAGNTTVPEPFMTPTPPKYANATPVLLLPPSEPTVGSVKLSVSGGTYTIPEVILNGREKASFTLDSGAADISVPYSFIHKMVARGEVAEADFLGFQTYVIADGTRHKSPVYRLRSVTIAGVTLRDVKMSASSDDDTWLLGQTFLGRLSSWSIDNATSTLTIHGVSAPGVKDAHPPPTAPPTLTASPRADGAF